MYFFLAGCEAKPRLDSHTMDWEVLRVGDSIWRQRSYQTKPLPSRIVPEKCLLDQEGHPIHGYDFYVHLRTFTAWRVPLFHGRLPRRPPEDAQPKDKGIYALFLMLFFRPHRDFSDIVRVATRNVAKRDAEDEIWIAIDAE